MPMAPRSAIASRRWKFFEISRLAPGATFFQIISLKENPKKCIETLRFWEHGGEILVFFLREMWPSIGDNILLEEIWRNTCEIRGVMSMDHHTNLWSRSCVSCMK